MNFFCIQHLSQKGIAFRKAIEKEAATVHEKKN
jgi:hypothetical protein